MAGTAAVHLKSVAPAHITRPDIFRGFMPLICIQPIVLTLAVLVPEVTMLFR